MIHFKMEGQMFCETLTSIMLGSTALRSIQINCPIIYSALMIAAMAGCHRRNIAQDFSKSVQSSSAVARPFIALI